MSFLERMKDSVSGVINISAVQRISVRVNVKGVETDIYVDAPVIMTREDEQTALKELREKYLAILNKGVA